MVEIYKIKNNLNPPSMNFVFERRNNMYNFRNFQEFATKRKRTVKVYALYANHWVSVGYIY